MNYHKIDNFNMNNGEGVRVVLWVSGCNHHCDGCFNPETWNANNGDKFTKKQLKFILESADEDWCSGLCISGGDPLFRGNLFAVFALCKKFKKFFPNKTIWIYSGYKYEEILKNPIRKMILKKCDVLVDGEYMNCLKNQTCKWRGSSNQRVIDVKNSLKSGKVVLYCE